jgi:hypothetical protein
MPAEALQSFFQRIEGQRRDRQPCASAQQPRPAERHRSQRPQERRCSFVTSGVMLLFAFPDHSRWDRCALIGSLRIGRCMTGLLDGLSTFNGIRLSSLSAGPDAMLVGVVLAGWPSAAIVPILSESDGADKPQYPVTKSIRFRRSASGGVLAVLAGLDAAAVGSAVTRRRC